ncbi:MAG: hypothetical protein LQ340_005758 [Diploschistes diacapsis]|nr:MAG: hypothetical protein LQ340_005758 [Diploschistes diacapsis]
MAPSTKSMGKEAWSAEQVPRTPTTATFVPTQTVSGNGHAKTLLVHQRSPLLISTPPQVTRALAFSHPFLLPLSRFLGYLTWSSGDSWESFLLLASFWTIVLYGDIVTRLAGPVILVVALIAGMYFRRYSPLSTRSTTDTPIKEDRKGLAGEGFKHQKSLDEIVEALNTFTSRCTILAEPFLQMTDFLSTQVTPTTVTTRPALTSLLIRILMVMPIWFGLSLDPICIITTKRVVLITGTLFLTWHSRPAHTSRSLLWRSLTVRRCASIITGLEFSGTAKADSETGPPLPPRRKSQRDAANSLATNQEGPPAGVRFTFVVYENQRRWLGLGWTSSMFAYERAAWSDEHLNASPSKDQFQLPQVEGRHAVWTWVPGSEWKVEGSSTDISGTSDKGRNDGWIYYDNKWTDGRRQDGWGRYTRRRKWFRDAELVEGNLEIPSGAGEYAGSIISQSTKADSASIVSSEKAGTNDTPTKRRGFFGTQSRASTRSSSFSRTLNDDGIDEQRFSGGSEGQNSWAVGDEVKMGLG